MAGFVAVGLVAAFLVPGLFLVPVHAAPSPAQHAAGSVGAVAQSGSERAVSGPAAAGATQLGVYATSSLNIYTILAQPNLVYFQLNVTNATLTYTDTSSVTAIWANVTDAITQTVCGTIDLTSLTPISVGTVTADGTPVTLANYTYTLTTGPGINETAFATNCPAVASQSIEFVIGATVVGTTTTASADTNATGTTPTTSLIFAFPSGSLTFKTTTTAFTYNLSSVYAGQYVGRVALTIYAPGTTNISFAANFVVTPAVNWYEPKAGDYSYTLEMFAPYGNTTNAGTLVLTSTIPVYTNSTTWVNSTIFGGLTPAVGGTILLLVGLIVGMIVALAVGRAMFGGRPAASPPQAWEGKGAAPAANTCSVCGKSFGTPEELAAHGKSDHGLQ